MNKYKEALDNILFYCGHTNYDKYLNPKVFEELKIIQELVDKATPQKPTKYKTIHHSIEDIILYKCQCGCCLSYAYNFCPKCGQAIKWGDIS